MKSQEPQGSNLKAADLRAQTCARPPNQRRQEADSHERPPWKSRIELKFGSMSSGLKHPAVLGYSPCLTEILSISVGFSAAGRLANGLELAATQVLQAILGGRV